MPDTFRKADEYGLPLCPSPVRGASPGARLRRFHLEILSGPEPGRRMEVGDALVLGRKGRSQLRFRGEEWAMVSAEHALVETVGLRLRLRDQGSLNGTYVNGKRVGECFLEGGDRISLGRNGPRLVVVAEEVEAAEASGEAPGAEGGGHGSRAGKRRSAWDEALELLKTPLREGSDATGEGLMTERLVAAMRHATRAYAVERRFILRVSAATALVSILAIGALVFQNLAHKAKLRRQGELITSIRELQRRLDAVGRREAADEQARESLVRDLGAQESRLASIWDDLHAGDRIDAYSHPLGWETHWILRSLGKKAFIVPETFIAKVEEYLRWYSSPRMRPTLDKAFAQKAKYQGMIRAELERRKLPPELFYLALHESLLDPQALSPAGARGLWQFMPATAREFGLAVPEHWRDLPAAADERTHALRSTRAAASYLHRLYSELGDAALVMAAYNAGGGKLRRALRRIEDPIAHRDFWYIHRMGLLPEETGEYVPKIIAIILIDRDPARYGFAAGPPRT